MATYHLSVKVGKRGSGGAHAEYVSRSGAYENYRGGEDLVHAESVNMPGWAAHDPAEFFRQADLHERANGSSYREYEIALPRELTPAQRVELVREFVQKEIGDRHPCTWAIHNPPAAIEGDDQPHAHIMFSDRRLDGIERDPEQFFKRANSKHPEKGGCAKANTPATSAERKAALVALRGRWADLQNHHLAEEAHPARVTHLSLKAQGIDRQPEKHLGPVNARDSRQTAALVKHRDAQERAAHHQGEASQINTSKTIQRLKREQAHEQHRQRNRQRNRRAGITEVQHLRGIDDLPAGHDPQRVLPGDERHHLDERQAGQGADRVHELDAQRAARAVADAQRAQAERQRQAQEAARKAAEAAQRAAEAERQRQATQQKAERLAAIQRTAQAEQQARPQRRQAWQAKHLRSPAITPRAGIPPAPGKPKYWEYSDGPAKGKACVVDYGDRIRPAGKLDKISDTKIAALLDVAKVKGWPALTINGPQDFRLRVAEAAQARGMPLADRDLVQALAERQEAARRAAAEQERMKAQMVKPITPSKPLSPAKPQQSALAEARAAWAQANAAREQAKARRAALYAPNPTPQPEAQPKHNPNASEMHQGTTQTHTGATETQSPPPTLKALKEELGKLQNEARLDLGSQIRKNQPEAYSEAQAMADARALAVAEINAEAKRDNNPQALPANQYEYDHTHGWARQVAGAEHALAEHQKTPKPFFGKAKAEWLAQEQTKAENLKLWKEAVKTRDLKLAKLTAEKLHQVKADHAKREAEKPAKLAQAQTRLKDVQERIGSIERTLKEPHYVREAQQQKEKQQGMGRGR